MANDPFHPAGVLNIEFKAVLTPLLQLITTEEFFLLFADPFLYRIK